MNDTAYAIPGILRESPVRVVFGPSSLSQLGSLARDEGATRALLVSDPGIVAAGHVERASRVLGEAGIEVVVFAGARENPTSQHVAQGLEIAQRGRFDFIIGLGGGSAMDCAKAINILLTNGGKVADYRGENKADKPMLPSILVPTTAGTGSEAQSFALISDSTTHQKIACGDRRLPSAGGLRPRVAILDPQLTATQPANVAAAAGIDAVTHAVETAATTQHNEISLAFSREAWNRLDAAYERAMRQPTDESARADMLLGAHLAGAAIEFSMLGAAHAGANPLTATFGIAHGVAVGILLPHVVRFNARDGANPYSAICDDAERLAVRIEELLAAGGLPLRLSECGVSKAALGELAGMAGEQWTARFNPRKVGLPELLEIYRAALD